MKIGYQAGLKLLRCRRAPDRHDALPARLGGALRARAGLRRLGRIGSRSSASTCATRRASRRSAASCSRRATRLDFIINNACQTVRRPPEFYAHMMAARDGARSHDMPAHVRELLGAYEGLRGYHLLPEGGAGCRRSSAQLAGASPGLTHAAELSQVPLLPEELAAQQRSVPARAGSTRTCSRSICATATPGGCCWPRCRRSSCSRCSWSTPSRRSSSTRG